MSSGGATKIFIGNVLKSTTSEVLKDLFSPFGEIVKCDVLNGYAFLFMKNESDAKQAISELDGRIFDDQRLTIQLSTRSTQGRLTGTQRHQANTKIFIGNLSRTTSKQKLCDMFETYGEVAETDVLAGYGFVHMVKEEEAFKAIKGLNGYCLDGVTIDVELSTANTQHRSLHRGDERPPRDHHSRERSLRDDGRGRSARYEPYDAPALRHSRPLPPPPSAFVDYQPPTPAMLPGPRERLTPGESFARDLLQLYIENPSGFDAYARNDVVRKSLDLPPLEVPLPSALLRRPMMMPDERFDQRLRPPDSRYAAASSHVAPSMPFESYDGNGSGSMQRYPSSSYQ